MRWLIIVILCAYAQKLEYSFYLLAMEWKPTACKTQKCAPGYVSESFNIHGLWPSSSMGFGPNDCPGEVFSITPATQQLLEVYWQSYKTTVEDKDGKSPNLWFWEHEWNKHGTCVKPQMKPDDYFRKVVELSRKLDLQKKFEEAGIKPGCSEHPISQFRQSIPASVKLSCSQSGSETLLKTVKVCFDLTFSLIDCKEASGTNCGNAMVLPSV